MRKVIWCCSAAGVLAAGGFLSLTLYACRCPNSMVGRSMQVIGDASITMQPLSGITSMAMRTNQATATTNETVAPLDEGILDDPQPIAPATAKELVGIVGQVSPVKEREFEEAAPIVIHEDDPMPQDRAVPVVPAPDAGEAEFKDIAIDVNEANTGILHSMQRQEVPRKGGPTPMPYCRDDDEEPAAPPKLAQAQGRGEAEENVFKAWMDLFAEGSKDKTPAVEQLPPPTEEEPQEEPKCQEDRHLHEQYPGCPRTTCPFSGKDRLERYYKRVWDLDSKLKKKGSEESSEEPPHPSKECKDKEECPRTKGVDTMEYRKSDAGLDEYGPGTIH